jgi:hypothetical protein
MPVDKSIIVSCQLLVVCCDLAAGRFSLKMLISNCGQSNVNSVDKDFIRI